MKITCYRLEDFVENILGNEDRVFCKTVWVSIVSNPIDGNQKNAVKFEVSFQVGCLFDGVLLEMGEICGIDYHDASQEFPGTTRAQSLRASLDAVCISRGLSVKPGIVGID